MGHWHLLQLLLAGAVLASGIAVLGVCGAIFYGALRPAPADGVEKVPIKL